MPRGSHLAALKREARRVRRSPRRHHDDGHFRDTRGGARGALRREATRLRRDDESEDYSHDEDDVYDAMRGRGRPRRRPRAPDEGFHECSCGPCDFVPCDDRPPPPALWVWGVNACMPGAAPASGLGARRGVPFV